MPKLVLIPSYYWRTSWCWFHLLIDTQVGVNSVFLSSSRLVLILSSYWHALVLILSSFWRTSWCCFHLLIDTQVGVDSIFLLMRKLVLILSSYWCASWYWFCLLIDVQVGVDSFCFLTHRLLWIPSVCAHAYDWRHLPALVGWCRLKYIGDRCALAWDKLWAISCSINILNRGMNETQVQWGLENLTRIIFVS